MAAIILPPYRRASSTARFFNSDVDCGLIGTWSPFAAYPITMACWMYFQQVGYATAQTSFVDISRPSGVSTNRFGVQGNFDFLGVSATAATGESATQQNQILHGDKKWQHVGGVFGSDTSRKSYHNGRFVAENTDNVPVNFSLLTNITIGQGNGLFGGSKHHGGLAEAAFWACELNTSEFGALAHGESPLRIRPQSLVAYYPLDEGRGGAINRAPATRGRYNLSERTAQLTGATAFPLRINQGARRRIYIPSAGVAAIDANASIVEANDSLVSVATVSITATAALSEEVDRLTAVGTVLVTATASLQEANDLLSAAAGTAAFASAALVEANDLLTSAATLAITATAALVEASDTSSAAATVSITATAALQEQNDLLTAEGGSASFATAALVEAADALTSTGTVLVTGTASLQEAADALASAVTVSITATAALLEAADRLTATGSVGTVVSTADAALVEAPDTATGTATVAVTGAAAIIEAGDILVSGVTLLVTATAILVEANDTLAATGGALDTRTATATMQEANDTLSATVVRRIARRIAASDSLAHGIAASDSARSITASDGLN